MIQRLGVQIPAEVGGFLIFKITRANCKLPISNKFQLGQNSNVPDDFIEQILEKVIPTPPGGIMRRL